MKHLPDIIFFIWLFPVALQIILPLGVFMFCQVKKLTSLRLAKVESEEPVTVGMKTT